ALCTNTQTSVAKPPYPPTVPIVSSGVGSPSKPVAVADQIGPSAVRRPRGTRMLLSGSSSPPPGSAAAGSVVADAARAATEIPPKAAVNCRREMVGMIFLDLCFGEHCRFGLNGAGQQAAQAVRGLTSPVSGGREWKEGGSPSRESLCAGRTQAGSPWMYRGFRQGGDSTASVIP